MNLIEKRRFVDQAVGKVLYFGPPSGLGNEAAKHLIEGIVSSPAVLEWMSQGGVVRDLEATVSWLQWLSLHNLDRFLKDDINAKLNLVLVVDQDGRNLNVIFRIEPIKGKGSISYRSYIARRGADEFVCFEY